MFVLDYIVLALFLTLVGCRLVQFVLSAPTSLSFRFKVIRTQFKLDGVFSFLLTLLGLATLLWMASWLVAADLDLIIDRAIRLAIGAVITFILARL